MPKKKEPVEITKERLSRTSAIVVAVIGLMGTLIVAYWQFVWKPAREPQPARTEYVGRVLDANTLQPVAGAKITLTLAGVPPIVYSDNEGTYRFQVDITSDISGQIRVDAPGYQPYIRNITISPENKVIEDIRLTP